MSFAAVLDCRYVYSLFFLSLLYVFVCTGYVDYCGKKDGSDEMSRLDAIANAKADDLSETPESKTPKKDKKKGKEEVATPDPNGESADMEMADGEAKKKKKKKDKKQEEEKQETVVVEEGTTEAPKKSKKDKRKAEADEGAEGPAAAEEKVKKQKRQAATTEETVAVAGADDGEKKKKKKNKDKKKE